MSCSGQLKTTILSAQISILKMSGRKVMIWWRPCENHGIGHGKLPKWLIFYLDFQPTESDSYWQKKSFSCDDQKKCQWAKYHIFSFSSFDDKSKVEALLGESRSGVQLHNLALLYLLVVNTFKQPAAEQIHSAPKYCQYVSKRQNMNVNTALVQILIHWTLNIIIEHNIRLSLRKSILMLSPDKLILLLLSPSSWKLFLLLRPSSFAFYCDTLQYTTTKWNVLQHIEIWSTNNQELSLTSGSDTFDPAEGMRYMTSRLIGDIVTDTIGVQH